MDDPYTNDANAFGQTVTFPSTHSEQMWASWGYLVHPKEKIDWILTLEV